MNKVLVTGANRGIGLEICRQLLTRGDQVIAVCRHSSDAMKGMDLRVIEGVDVSSDKSIALLKDQMANEKLDWLINNQRSIFLVNH